MLKNSIYNKSRYDKNLYNFPTQQENIDCYLPPVVSITNITSNDATITTPTIPLGWGVILYIGYNTNSFQPATGVYAQSNYSFSFSSIGINLNPNKRYYARWKPIKLN